MTIIAWDGKTLCADKMAIESGTIRIITKIRRCKRTGHLLAFCGQAVAGFAMMEWYEDGADPVRFPPAQHKADADSWADFWVIHQDGSLFKYERHPVAIPYEGSTFTDGAGMEFAAGAMAMGASAVQAVIVACDLSPKCGNGYDKLTFNDVR